VSQSAADALGLDKGLIVEHGAPAEFFDAPQDARTREFLGHML